LAAALAAVLAALAPAAAADTFVANRLGDPAPDRCRPAACTLREAVLAANDNAGPDRILVRAGERYRLRRSGTDDAGEVGDLDVTGPVTIRPQGGGRTTIDATRTDRVLHVPGPGARTRLVRIVVRGGGGGADVGGIEAESRLILTRSVVAGNRGTDDGGIRADAGLITRSSRIVNNRGGAAFGSAGGIDAGSPTGDVVIANSEISGNRGGGIGGAHTEGPATIVRSEISDNPGRPGMLDMGGGLRIDAGTRIARTTIARNRGETVGGIDAEGLGGNEALLVVRSRIRGNRAAESGFGDGAGIKAYARLRIVRSKVLGNRAGGVGGGIANRGEHTVIATTTFRANRSEQAGGALSLSDTIGPHQARISRSTLRDNRADDGGGLSFVASDPTSLLRAVNTTIAGNRADQNGGGLELRGGTANLNALTVARNRADADEAGGGSGGGISQGEAFGVGAAVVVSNSLLALNRVGPDGSDPQCSGTYTSGGGNLITKRPGCTDLAGPQDRVRARPRIGRLGAHGGPTPTIPLLRRSPAINAARGTAPPRDQRGVRRRNPDVGAYERR